MKNNMTIQETMDVLRTRGIACSRKTIYLLINNGDLEVLGKSGKHTVIDLSSVNRYINKKVGISDPYMWMYVRTSSKKDPRGRKRSELLGTSMEWIRDELKTMNIPLLKKRIGKGHSWGRYENLSVHTDCGSVNDNYSTPLVGMETMFREMRCSAAKKKILWLYSIDRMVRGDIRLLETICKAMDVIFICRDLVGKSEPEKEMLSKKLIAYAYEARKDLNDRRDSAINRDKAAKDEEFRPLVQKALRQANADPEKRRLIGGLILAWKNKDRNPGLKRSFEQVLGQGGGGMRGGKGPETNGGVG